LKNKIATSTKKNELILLLKNNYKFIKIQFQNSFLFLENKKNYNVCSDPRDTVKKVMYQYHCSVSFTYTYFVFVMNFKETQSLKTFYVCQCWFYCLAETANKIWLTLKTFYSSNLHNFINFYFIPYIQKLYCVKTLRLSNG
jgi:hypothetical protein